MEPSINTNVTLEHLQPSVLVLVIKILATLFLLDTAYTLLLFGFFGLSGLGQWHGSYIALLWVAHTVKYMAIIVLIVRIFSEWAGHAYYLSGHHIIERVGLMNVVEKTYEMSDIKSIALKQSWFGRHFNFGTIRLSLSRIDSQQTIILHDINSPHRYKKYFDDYV